MDYYSLTIRYKFNPITNNPNFRSSTLDPYKIDYKSF